MVAHSTCLLSRAPPNNDFYLDSGATQHMAHQRSLFTNFKPIQPGKRWISGIGQSHVEILGTGDIIITSPVEKAHQTITLPGALYAPNLQINLVSVGSITAKGGEILFTHSRVNAVRNGVLLLTGNASAKISIDSTSYHIQETPCHIQSSHHSQLLPNHLQIRCKSGINALLI